MQTDKPDASPPERRRRSDRNTHDPHERPLPMQAAACAQKQYTGQKPPAHHRRRKRRGSKRRKLKHELLQAGKMAADYLMMAAIGLLFAGQWLWNKARALYEWVRGWIGQRLNPEGDFVHRKHKHRNRYYYYVPDDHGQHRRVRTTCMVALASVLAFSVFRLGAYGMDYLSSKRTSDELREAYYQAMSEETDANTPVPATPSPAPTPTATSEPQATPTPTATPRTMLSRVGYPDNPYATVSSRFKKIRRQNSDIIGWLTIPELIDEAVVQRDNSYYLRRDYRGYHNDNGAIFLEESCNLDSRPYTLMLFGHNMKSGAMFGCLRNYENINFYRKNPFITFDTAYEDGRYVIFSVGTLSQNKRDRNFVDITSLVSSNIEWREKAIAQLKKISEFSSSIEVTADDQILLLITCVDDDTERRVVAARRVRDGESESWLQKTVNKSRSR